MVDTILGPVTEVVDGDTFHMKVTHKGRYNQYPYENYEKIRLEDIDRAELRTREGKRAKHLLEKWLLDREVRCYVRARDSYGRLVCNVKILG